MDERMFLKLFKILISILSDEQKRSFIAKASRDADPDIRWLARDVRLDM